ncbi:small G-protein [Trypanosoma theileri]|uniref:Small G-protein n=1 Tax=Trypanosoma theileri TaxID=67003 RepID=A0A1X0NLK7_9TRYP|nr:small G-protein [Trypanosoma theileri]ORC85585.1 small G-protein [Trypanosoma theileri]
MLECVENSIKVIVVGDGNVGKTSMLRRFVKGEFLSPYKRTIGAEFMEKNVFLRYSNRTVKLMLWDTAGQEVFNSLTQAYYRGAAAAILAFSTVDKDSFMNVPNWKKNVENVCGSIPMVLCQTKFDLVDESVVTNEEAEQLAMQLQVPFFRVSTKDDFNVTQVFEFTADMCLSKEKSDDHSGLPDAPFIGQGDTGMTGSPTAGRGMQSARNINLSAKNMDKKKKHKKNRCDLF